MKKMIMLLITIAAICALTANVFGSTASEPALQKLPEPVSNHANDFFIYTTDSITLTAPSICNATVVYTMTDPNNECAVTWIPFSTPILPTGSGILEFWAKSTITGDEQFQDSDIVHFSFVALSRPTEPVVMRFTMNQLEYSIGSIVQSFEFAPYLDKSENRSMIPSRFIVEVFGANVIWNERTRTMTISLDGKTVNPAYGLGTVVIK